MWCVYNYNGINWYISRVLLAVTKIKSPILLLFLGDSSRDFWFFKHMMLNSMELDIFVSFDDHYLDLRSWESWEFFFKRFTNQHMLLSLCCDLENGERSSKLIKMSSSMEVSIMQSFECVCVCMCVCVCTCVCLCVCTWQLFSVFTEFAFIFCFFYLCCDFVFDGNMWSLAYTSLYSIRNLPSFTLIPCTHHHGNMYIKKFENESYSLILWTEHLLKQCLICVYFDTPFFQAISLEEVNHVIYWRWFDVCYWLVVCFEHAPVDFCHMVLSYEDTTE